MHRFATLTAILFMGIMDIALTALGSPIINEILYRPGFSYPENTQLEFVELYNPTDSVIDLSGWSFTKGLTYTFPQGASILARG
jgi:predicted extracellular nuclease